MSEFLFVKTVEGRRVKHPISQKLLEAGKVHKVTKSQFWFRRLEDGDVVLHEESEAKAEVKTDAKKKKAGE